VCKYKKGEWGECEPLTQLLTRQDILKPKHSSPDCAQTRTLTKHCKDNNETVGGKGPCVFEKSHSVPWTECQHLGVRQKVLKLISENSTNICPRQKLLSRKCKDEKKIKENKKKKIEEKNSSKSEIDRRESEGNHCEFHDWTGWETCTGGQQHRTRNVTSGIQDKVCEEQATETRKC